MNYYSPYFNYPQILPTSLSNSGLLGNAFGKVKGLNWSNILSNIQKTLGIVNQTIPMVKQISPIMSNAKTMFKIMNEFKKNDVSSENFIKQTNTVEEKTIDNGNLQTKKENYDNQPIFFIN